jgi:GT2 family glycosyltransferase
VDWVIGAALAVRRAVLDKVGLLDEKFFMYAEDVDWCWRIRQAGWRVVYLPSAVVMHHYEKSAGKAPYRTNYARHRSMWRFYHKHYSRGIALLDAATFAGILARFLVTTVRLFLRRGWPRLTSGSRSRS